MPLPAAALAAGASAASNLVGGAMDAFFTNQQNYKSRKFSREMYDRTRSDNLEFWNMTNEYNTPQAQMKRFQEAGLNPNLIYGQGNSGSAGSIPTPDVQSAQFRVPEIGNAVSRAGNVIGDYLDYEIKGAQLDNLRTDNTVKQEDAMLRRAQTRSMMTNEERARFDLEFERGLSGVSADARREQLRKTKVETDVMLSRNEREVAMNSSNLREAAERILSMRSQRATSAVERQRIREDINRLRNDVELKRLDIELKRMGIQPHDPIYLRMLAQFIGRDALLKTGKSIGSFFNR